MGTTMLLSIGMLASSIVLTVSAAGEDMGPIVGVGAHVRATTAGGRVVGTLVSQGEDGLRIETEPGKQVMVPLRDLSALEQGHRRSRGRGALIGFAVGALGGAIWGASDGSGGGGCDPAQGFCFLGPGPLFSREDTAMMGAGLLGGLGALVGALVPPGEKWEAVSAERLRVSVVPLRRGLGVRVAIAF